MATILTDNFNSYTDGDLNGQGSWVASTSIDVQGTKVKEGAKALQALSAGSAYKIGTQEVAGTSGCYMMISETSAGAEPYFVIEEDAAAVGYIRLSANNEHVWGRTLTDWVDLGTFTFGTWVWVQIEWRSSPSHQIRYRMGESGTWSDWQSPADSDWTTGPNKIYLQGGYDTIEHYWDFIAENPYAPPATSTTTSTTSTTTSSTSTSTSSTSTSTTSSSSTSTSTSTSSTTTSSTSTSTTTSSTTTSTTSSTSSTSTSSTTSSTTSTTSSTTSTTSSTTSTSTSSSTSSTSSSTSSTSSSTTTSYPFTIAKMEIYDFKPILDRETFKPVLDVNIRA